MKKVLAFLAVLSVAGMASADLMVEYGPSAVQPTMAGYTSYTVYLVSDTLDNAASSIDGRFDGAMYQVDDNSIYYADMDARAQMNDSCLVISVSDLAVGRAIGEDNDHSVGWVEYPGSIPPPPPAYWAEEGLGSYIANSDGTQTFALGVLGDAQATNKAFAQLVIPDGQTVTFTADMAKRGGGGVHVEVLTPEPATLSLLVLGGFGALLRRRR